MLRPLQNCIVSRFLKDSVQSGMKICGGRRDQVSTFLHSFIFCSGGKTAEK